MGCALAAPFCRRPLYFYWRLLTADCLLVAGGCCPMAASCLLLSTAPSSRRKAQSPRIKAHDSSFKAQGLRLNAQASRLKAQGARLQAIGCKPWLSIFFEWSHRLICACARTLAKRTLLRINTLIQDISISSFDVNSRAVFVVAVSRILVG